ncbi:hypothetical protein RSAG8_00640, partial [Rhizoctonia solani AG-8 WAC10335]
MMLQLFRLDWP